MKYLKIFVTILALFGISSCARDIIDLTGTIEGIVKDKTTGAPLSNCEILLTPTNKAITTSSDGVYRFTALDQGEYTLTFNRSGYISNTRSVSVKSGETSTVDMLLEAKSSFSLSEEVYDFGDLESSKTFICFNNSASDCSYTLSNLPVWILVNKEQGSVKAGSNDSFTLTIDRSKVGIGSYSQNITVTYSGHINGTTTLLVKMKKVEYTTPSITTATSATTVSENSFMIDGTITGTGGSQITAYGHCWSTSANPTINGQCTNFGMTEKIGAFTSSIEHLFANTTYYVRAYATNAQGTSYGEQVIVKTQTTGTDVWNGQIAESFAGGSGSKFDPYIIKTGGQLLLMKNVSESAYFKMESDINLNNNNWLPFYFSGSLDGNGHTIYNLRVARDTDYQGLFSDLSGTVENLKINGVDIQAPGSSCIGGLAGVANYATIQNCEIYYNSALIGNEHVGGLVGKTNWDLNIKNCRVNSNESGCIKGNQYVGGIVGYIAEYSTDDVIFSNNHAQIDLEGGTLVGGCFGGVYGAEHDFLQCSYKGDIRGEGAIGGIAGSLAAYNTVRRNRVIACKSEVNITASNTANLDLGVGGIIGNERYSDYATIICCYSSGTISSSGNHGAIAPSLDGRWGGISVSHSYSAVVIDAEYRTTYYEGTSIYETTNIAQVMREYYSSLSEYWNYDNTWTWTGEVDGKQVSVLCPKLAWEE